MGIDEFVPKVEGGLLLNGCPPLTPESRILQTSLADSAVSLPEYAWVERGDMPIVKWDASFDQWLDHRIELADAAKERGHCFLPWRILKSLPSARKASDILTWYQGMIPDCSFHGGTHSAQNTLLREIALGAPLKYESFLPILPFWLSKGRSLAGGQTIAKLAEWMNRCGQYPSSMVGDNNMAIPNGWEKFETDAKRWQVGIVFLENDIVDRILKACHALLDVTFGSSLIYSSAKKDKNGVKVVSDATTGGHAQSIGSYRTIGSEEYVFLQNSHGEIYGQSEEGEPASGAWMNRDQLERIAASMLNYGYPFIVFVEGDITAESSLVNDFDVPFPKDWKR